MIMAERELGPASAIVGGKTIELTIEDSKATLYLPDSWNKTSSHLWVHFHSAPWYVVSEYNRAGNTEPVLIFNLGQGSTVYAKPFLNKGVFSKWLTLAQQESGMAETWSAVSLTSFSAGYGAVRQIVQESEILDRLKTVILGDSLYASLDSAQPGRKVLKEHLDVWAPLAKRAMEGKTTWIISTSQITPESYAGTWEVAMQLVESLGGQMLPADENEPATKQKPQSLARTYSKGRWFVWSYEGDTPVAHMTHARRLAEMIIESKK